MVVVVLWLHLLLEEVHLQVINSILILILIVLNCLRAIDYFIGICKMGYIQWIISNDTWLQLNLFFQLILNLFI